MNNITILTETTLKLKTKILIFSGVSLFIGLTKTLPTKLSLIGFNLVGNEKILGWFLFIITVSLFSHFLLLVVLDITKYFKNNILHNKFKLLTGDTLGMTLTDIEKENERQEKHNQEYEKTGSFSEEIDDIKREIQKIENNFDKKHLTFYNVIELFFNVIIPTILTIFGVYNLYIFLII